MAVHRNLGPGYRENSYQRDLGSHLTDTGLAFEAQNLLEVYDTSMGEQLIGY